LKSTGGLDRSSTEIRDDIAAKRESISRTVGRLGERIHESLDWREHVARYPYVAVGAAVGAGLLLSTLFKKKRSPMDRVVDVLVDRADQMGEDLRKSVGRLVMKTAAPGLIRGTIYGLAGKALMQYLQARAAAAEGNGAHLSADTEWRPRSSTPSDIS